MDAWDDARFLIKSTILFWSCVSSLLICWTADTTSSTLTDALPELLFKPRRLVSSFRSGSCIFPSVLTTSVRLLWATSEASFAVWIYGMIVPSCSERAFKDASAWSLLSRISSLEPLMMPLAFSASFNPCFSSLTPLLMLSKEAASWSMLSYNWVSGHLSRCPSHPLSPRYAQGLSRFPGPSP